MKEYTSNAVKIEINQCCQLVLVVLNSVTAAGPFPPFCQRFVYVCTFYFSLYLPIFNFTFLAAIKKQNHCQHIVEL